MEKPKPKSKAKPKPDRKKSDQNGDGRVNPPVAGENPKYADSLFTMLFKTKEEVLNLHRTLHPEDEITADSILLCTLRNVVINNRYNDLAYLVDNRLIILIEHQTTKNPNLPLRLLLYLALEYERIIREMGIDLFGKSLHRLPAPALPGRPGSYPAAAAGFWPAKTDGCNPSYPKYPRPQPNTNAGE